ncbi:MAG: hypothetical protein VBE63_18365 [Lamprobacter sp.]|uniref:hypothetical protein n=1 Tax=Lamprobacter sp. TaxID=3100796 RepID=UPI002B25D50A|nr:hypothetical protein [Lamprobacter sp.]MEA3641880.1 hypothetical protein [Lamprobacter sp.]
MSDLLQSALAAIPEDFFHRLEERMCSCTATAYEQAVRTPPETPSHRMRLGTTRYFERGEAFRLSAEDVSMRYRFEQVNTHAFALAMSGNFLITHAKINHWGDPIEQKEYKQTLARQNPTGGDQLRLWNDQTPDAVILALIVVLYARPGSGQDETLPMRLGFGIPTRDLKGWHLLKTLDQLYAAYAEYARQPLDRARPTLKFQQVRADRSSGH